MTMSDCSLSLWLLFECSLSILWVHDCHPKVILKSSWSHPKFILKLSWSYNEVIMKSSWSHHEVIMKSSWNHHEVIMKSSWRIWGWKMKIECSRQTCPGQTDRVTPWAPVGAKNIHSSAQWLLAFGTVSLVALFFGAMAVGNQVSLLSTLSA